MCRRRLRRSSSARLWSFVLCLWALPGALAFAKDAEDIVHNGNGNGAPACMSCHGEHGEGNLAAGYPRLSGFAPDYILHELQSFDDGSRANEIMQTIAKALSEEDRKALAAFYADSIAPKLEDGKAPDAKVLARGKLLADTGDWARGLPGCGQCHGPAGQGVGTAFPALAGQPAAYLAAQFAAWKGKTRTNDPLGLMAGLAAKMTDADVAAVSAYYASLPIPAGNKGPAR